MFNGSRGTDPHTILKSEYGIDSRFSNAGRYGFGIYFADNSNYCLEYAYKTPQNEYQMMMAFVIVGESISMNPDKSLRMPPMINLENRYDSVKNLDKSHTIIYDSNKHYPAYLITFSM